MPEKRNFLKLILILFGAVFCSLLYYGWEKHHVAHTRYEIACANDSASCGSVVGLTRNNYLVDASFSSYQKNVYFLGDTAGIEGISVYDESRKPVYIPVSELSSADTATINHKIFPSTGRHAALYNIPQKWTKKNSLFPFARKLVNWGGDAQLLKRSVFNNFNLGVLILVLIAVFLLPRLRNIYNGHSPVSIPVTKHPRHGLLIQLLLFLFLFGILLLLHPYYFLHDDNYAQFQPVIVFSMDEFYQTGKLPVYNPYQFAGIPTLPSSVYSLLYPVTHLSYLLSRFVLGDAVHFTTVFCFIHFFCGYYFFCRLLKKLNIPFGYATMAAACFVFSGFVLTLCSSWYYAAPSVAFLPLLAWLSIRTRGRWIIQLFLFIIVFALYAYSGNLQFCIYAFCFWAVFMLLRPKLSWRPVTTVLATALGMALLYLPQAIVSLPVVNSLHRTSLSYENTFPYLQKVVFPVERQLTGLFKPNNNYWQHETSFYNVHFLFLLPAFLLVVWGLLAWATFRILPRSYKILVLLFFAAVLFSLGKAGLLWPVTGNLPLFNKFQHPFKFLLFIIFFGSIAGVLFITWLRSAYIEKPLALRLLNTGVYGFGITGLLLTFIFCQQNFNRYGYRTPYARAPWMSMIAPNNQYRIYAAGASTAPDRSASLMFNFGTQYKMPSAGGWEELNNIYPDALQYGRQFGVRYYILSEFSDYKEGLNIQPGTEYYTLSEKIAASLPVVYRDSSIRIYEDDSAKPLLQVFQHGVAQPVGCSIQYHARGVTFLLNEEISCEAITLGFIWRPKLNVYLNGKEYTAEKDEYQRVLVHPSGSFRKIELLYEPYR